MKVGSYYWVRFKNGITSDWQPGQYQVWNGQPWVALIYNTAHYGLESFEVGREIVNEPSENERAEFRRGQLDDLEALHGSVA